MITFHQEVGMTASLYAHGLRVDVACSQKEEQDT